MSHPLEWIPVGKGAYLFAEFFVLTALTMAGLGWAGTMIKPSKGPGGILGFEFAGTPGAARAMVEAWDTKARSAVAFSLGLDFLFLVLYSSTLALACLWAGRQLGPIAGTNAGPLMAWAQTLAGLLDACENVALLRILFGRTESPWPEAARWCALSKFALIGLGLVFVAVGVVVKVVGNG